MAIAHRGGAALAPENTLVAFWCATSLGLRYLETDVRATSDGEVVCFHDATLDRVTDGHGRVQHHSLRQLRSLRVHGRAQIPTLAEALEAFPDSNFTIDLKDEAAIEPLCPHPARRTGADACLHRRQLGRMACAASTPRPRAAHGTRMAFAVSSGVAVALWSAVTSAACCRAVRPRPDQAGIAPDPCAPSRDRRPRTRGTCGRVDRRQPDTDASAVRRRSRRDHHRPTRRPPRRARRPRQLVARRRGPEHR